tara:strand:+ start:2510 stop:3355 length:846 start_codon:yes stop_codon:yes gene_type:complete
MNFKKIFPIILLALLTVGCTAKTEKNNRSKISDSKGIVSLTSLTSDIIFTLKPDELVGIPGSSILRKNKALDSITTISEGRTPPNLEKIISLNPKLVIGSKGFHDKTLDKLEELGIGVLSTKVNSWPSLISLIEDISKLTNSDTQRVYEKLESCFVEASPKNKKVVVLVSTKPLLSPNNESWAGSLLEKFNLKNLTADLEGSGRMKGYLNLSPEWLIKEEPDNLILIRFGDEQYNQYNTLPFWNDLKAVKNNKINYFEYYGLINVGSLNSINKTCEKLESL